MDRLSGCVPPCPSKEFGRRIQVSAAQKRSKARRSFRGPIAFALANPDYSWTASQLVAGF